MFKNVYTACSHVPISRANLKIPKIIMHPKPTISTHGNTVTSSIKFNLAARLPYPSSVRNTVNGSTIQLIFDELFWGYQRVSSYAPFSKLLPPTLYINHITSTALENRVILPGGGLWVWMESELACGYPMLMYMAIRLCW